MFRFTLQPILGLHEQQEDLAKCRLAEALAVCDAEKRKLNTIFDEIQTLAMRLRQQLNDAEELVQGHHFMQHLSEQLRAQREVLVLCQKQVESLREELLQFKLEVKKLDRLKGRRYAEYLEQEQKQEQIIIDELAINSFSRKHLGGEMQ